MSDLRKKIASFGLFLLELMVYACFVSAYFFLVLHFLGIWVKHVFDQNRTLYAIVSFALILMQGFLLERVTSMLLWVIRRKVR